MKVKVNELSGKALDWAVADLGGKLPLSYDDWRQKWPRYSQDWGSGGPLIADYCIDLAYHATGDHWSAFISCDAGSFHLLDGNPLVAAMRCLVLSRLGPEIEVPDELLPERAPCSA